MIKMKAKTLFVLITILIEISSCIYVFATPEGPNSVLRGDSTRKSLETGGQTQEAEAGNMTSLKISATTITKRWQGFYGNVSGGITLDNADNFTLYHWGLITPSGEIYASNGSSVSWSTIQCVNFTADESSGTASKYNLTILNRFIGLSSDSEQAEDDSVNATFNQTYGEDGSSFQVGSITIGNINNCSMTSLFNDTGFQTNFYQEVLLTDNESIIFTALIEQNTLGFQNSSLDFEMLVGVNGTEESRVRDYFFYIELS
jgi:hypothetical protein